MSWLKNAEPGAPLYDEKPILASVVEGSRPLSVSNWRMLTRPCVIPAHLSQNGTFRALSACNFASGVPQCNDLLTKLRGFRVTG